MLIFSWDSSAKYCVPTKVVDCRSVAAYPEADHREDDEDEVDSL